MAALWAFVPGSTRGEFGFQLSRFSAPRSQGKRASRMAMLSAVVAGLAAVAGRLRVVSLEVRGGPAGCGRMLCRHALPGGVVALGIY